VGYTLPFIVEIAQNDAEQRVIAADEVSFVSTKWLSHLCRAVLLSNEQVALRAYFIGERRRNWDFLAMKLRIGLEPSEKYPKN